MNAQSASLLAGGALWLAGVALLESGQDVESVVVRIAFALAGTSTAYGLVGLWPRLPARAARIGLVVSAVSCFAVGFGFAASGFVGFILAYSGILFGIPVGLAMLGFGVRKGGGLPRWAQWIPVILAAAGAVTYSFHALARDVWDPSDAVMFVLLGIGWMLLGIAALSPESRVSNPVP